MTLTFKKNTIMQIHTNSLYIQISTEQLENLTAEVKEILATDFTLQKPKHLLWLIYGTYSAKVKAGVKESFLLKKFSRAKIKK